MFGSCALNTVILTTNIPSISLSFTLKDVNYIFWKHIYRHIYMTRTNRYCWVHVTMYMIKMIYGTDPFTNSCSQLSSINNLKLASAPSCTMPEVASKKSLSKWGKFLLGFEWTNWITWVGWVRAMTSTNKLSPIPVSSVFTMSRIFWLPNEVAKYPSVILAYSTNSCLMHCIWQKILLYLSAKNIVQ